MKPLSSTHRWSQRIADLQAKKASMGLLIQDMFNFALMGDYRNGNTHPDCIGGMDEGQATAGRVLNEFATRAQAFGVEVDWPLPEVDTVQPSLFDLDACKPDKVAMDTGAMEDDADGEG